MSTEKEYSQMLQHLKCVGLEECPFCGSEDGVIVQTDGMKGIFKTCLDCMKEIQ